MGKEKKNAGEQKTEKKKQKANEAKKPESQGEDKKEEESKNNTPTPPPTVIVFKVRKHCKRCAEKVRLCLKEFPGVDSAKTDPKKLEVRVEGVFDPAKLVEFVQQQMGKQAVTVKEEVAEKKQKAKEKKADEGDKERKKGEGKGEEKKEDEKDLQRKSPKKVAFIFRIPKPPAEEGNKPEEKEKPALEEKKEEPVVIPRVHMCSETCAGKIKRRILTMKGVESAEPDLKKSEVSVKGVFDPAKLVEFVQRMRKQAVIVKEEATEKKEKADEGGKERKKEEGNGEEEKEEKKEGEGAAAIAEEEGTTLEETKVVEMKKSGYQYDPPRYIMEEMYAYPPQIFSDENPNACSVM